MNPFQIIKSSSLTLARTGVLRFEGARKPIQTPGLLIPTVRGAVLHLTPDNVANGLVSKPGFVIAAEDFYDKSPMVPSLLEYPEDPQDGVRGFFCLPEETPIVAMARRSVPEHIARANTDKTIGISTSEGGKELPVDSFNEFVQKLKPEIVLSIPDMPHSSGNPGGNRLRKMLFRTERWMEKLSASIENESGIHPLLFAPILPIDLRSQQYYLEYLQSSKLGGLSFWNTDGNASEKSSPAGPESWENTLDVVTTNGLDKLVRYIVPGRALSPIEILELISVAGIDIFNDSLSSEMSNAGVALDFTFPAPAPASDGQESPVWGLNLWESKYKVDMNGFGKHTPNFCAPHNRAFIHHLLDAREMTAPLLLQKHNSNVMALFFDGIRQSIANGSFEEEKKRFEQVYGGQDLKELRDRCKDLVPAVRSFSR